MQLYLEAQSGQWSICSVLLFNSQGLCAAALYQTTVNLVLSTYYHFNIQAYPKRHFNTSSWSSEHIILIFQQNILVFCIFFLMGFYIWTYCLFRLLSNYLHFVIAIVVIISKYQVYIEVLCIENKKNLFKVRFGDVYNIKVYNNIVKHYILFILLFASKSLFLYPYIEEVMQDCPDLVVVPRFKARGLL